MAYIQPDTPEMKIRICEKRDHSIDVSGSTEKSNNTIIEGYNH
ncbi:MAG: hypothetical protein P8X84_06395 [Candidatus Bathyarchaeota archaeon]